MDALGRRGSRCGKEGHIVGGECGWNVSVPHVLEGGLLCYTQVLSAVWKFVKE